MKEHTKKIGIATTLCIIALLGYGAWKHGSSPLSSKNGVVSTSPESALQKSYVHSDNSFTMQIPGDFNYSDLTQDDGSETVLFVGSNTARNFQIHIATYKGTGPLTVSIIQQSIPDLLMENPEAVAIDGAQGVAFISGPKDGTLRTREVWFSHAGNLYQISTFKDFDIEMVGILSTWKWQ